MTTLSLSCFAKRLPTFMLASLLAGLAASCAPSVDDNGASPDNERVQVALTAIPAATQCVRFTTLAGGRTFEQTFNVVGAPSLTAMVQGLPAGQALTISADAFAVACTAITATTQATWISTPVSVTLTPGVIPTLSFVLRPATGLSGAVDFLFLTATPASKAFPSVTLGQNSLATFTVQNVATSATGALAASLAGTGASQFAIGTNGCTAALTAAQTCTIQVRFAPTTAGAKTATLQLVGTPGGTLAVSLTGTGVLPALLSIAPGSQDFGAVGVGRTSPPVAFTVTNAGGATSGAVVVASSDPAFVVSGSTCGVLMAGQGCTFNVQFAPAIVQSRSATLTAAAPGVMATAAVTGNGVAAPALALSPNPLAFGTVFVGQPKSMPISVRNVGGLPLGPFSVFLGGANTADFSIDARDCQSRPSDLLPQDMCLILVQANPVTGSPAGSGGGPVSNATVLVMGGGANPVSAMATISATPSFPLTPNVTSFDFGSAKVGTAGLGTVFTYTNVGGIAVGPVVFTSSNQAVYTAGPSSCGNFQVAPGGNCQVMVRFNAPATPGPVPGGLAVSGVAGGAPGINFHGLATP